MRNYCHFTCCYYLKVDLFNLYMIGLRQLIMLNVQKDENKFEMQ